MRLNPKTDDKKTNIEHIKPRFLLRNKSLLFFILCSFVTGVYCGWKNVPGKIKAHYNLLLSSELIPSLWEENDLKTIHLSINFKNFQKIALKREQAMEIGKLEANSKDYVKANISYDNHPMECKVRLKGDLSDHWSGSKWSLRVNMEKGNTLWGMSSFSLQDPATRLNTNEWLYLKTLKREGLLSVRYDFVNLKMNGKSMGIYAIEEHFSKEFIESNERRQGVVVSFDDYLNWRKEPANKVRNINVKTLYRSLPVKVRDSNRVKKNPILLKQTETAFHLVRKLQDGTMSGDEIFWPEKLGKFLAICHIWHAPHNLQINNINFFYDPISAQLEPIGFDAWANSPTANPYCFFTLGDSEYSWFNHALRSPRIAYHYINALSIYSKKNYEQSIKSELMKEELKFRRLITRDLLGRSSASIWRNFTSLLNCEPWNAFELRNARIRDELSEKKPISAFGILSENNQTIEIVLRNALTQPVEIIGFVINGEQSSPLDNLVTPIDENFDYKVWQSSFVLPVQKFENQKINGEFRFNLRTNLKPGTNFETPTYILARLLGLDSEPLKIKLPVSYAIKKNSLPFSKTGKKALDDHDFITKLSSNQYLVSVGNHRITTDLFVPANSTLLIKPSTSLLFDENCSIISLGSVMAKGSVRQPIRLTSSSSSWGGILVYQSTSPSKFEHCIFENINGVGKASNPNGIDRDGWNMSGSVNLYHTEAAILNCRFNNLFTEDALNIIHSSFELNDSNFTNLFSDGFDGDFVRGAISNCNFEKIKGDGVDFSGSDVSIRECHFHDIEDKAVSAGEKSVLKIDSISASSVGYGVVSKDQSEVSLSKSTIHNASISAIAAYQKKLEFGPAKIIIRDTNFSDSSQNFMIQSQSYGEHDGVRLKTHDFSAQSLYQEK